MDIATQKKLEDEYTEPDELPKIKKIGMTLSQKKVGCHGNTSCMHCTTEHKGSQI